jgi:Ca2+-binding EF-hand superfamily protein
MRKFTLIIAASSMALGGVAYAQSAERPDRNASQTRDQAQARATAMFERMDANDDGTIDAADRQAKMLQRFARIDTDNNGSISQAEFLAMHEARGEKAGKRGRRGGAKMGMRGMKGMGVDGAMTQAQFEAAALARFDQADANGDGTLTAAERQAARKAMREARRAARTAS